MTFFVTKNIGEFSAAHRIVNGYQDKCADLHGHNYQVKITLKSETINNFGFVLDFKLIKEICLGWINSKIDHCVLVSKYDKPLLEFVVEQRQKYYYLENSDSSSVEYIAKHLYEIFNQLFNNDERIPKNVALYSIEIFETKTSSAIYKNNSASMD